ncbi:MAG: DUF5985 family protein [Gemmatimonadaceae bacterium]
MTRYELLVAGALTMGYVVAALFFFRFWRQTADRLFALFAASFVILAVQRVALALTVEVQANAVCLYSLRLFAFLLILAAILEKNMSRPGA